MCMDPMERHFDIAGWMHVATGLLGLASLAAVAALFAPTLARLDPALPPDALVAGLSPLALLYGLMGFGAAALVLFGLISLATGYGLIKRRPWGMNTALVVSFMQLMNIPLGTAVAAYTLWALLSAEGKAAWEATQRR